VITGREGLQDAVANHPSRQEAANLPEVPAEDTAQVNQQGHHNPDFADRRNIRATERLLIAGLLDTMSRSLGLPFAFPKSFFNWIRLLGQISARTPAMASKAKSLAISRHRHGISTS